MNKVWIELQVSSDQEENKARAKLAHNMLKKLGIKSGTYDIIWWHERKQVYCVTTSEAGTFMEMGDKGHWFNLDYLGREE
jgi:hypothetical protein